MRNKFLTWVSSHKLLAGVISVILIGSVALAAVNNYPGEVFWPWWLPYPSFNLTNNTVENPIPCKTTYEEHVHGMPGLLTIRGQGNVNYFTTRKNIDETMRHFYWPMYRDKDSIITLNNTSYTTLQGSFSFTVGTVNMTGRGGFEELKDLTCLEYLQLSGWWWINDNNFTGIEDLQNLLQLDLGETKITDITLIGKLIKLEALSLQGNAITDFSPLEKLINLKVLDLSNTKISDLKPLAKLTELYELKLFNTPITDITPLASLTKLRRLYFPGDAVSCKQQEELVKQLPKLKLLTSNCAELQKNNPYQFSGETYYFQDYLDLQSQELQSGKLSDYQQCINETNDKDTPTCCAANHGIYVTAFDKCWLQNALQPGKYDRCAEQTENKQTCCSQYHGVWLTPLSQCFFISNDQTSSDQDVANYLEERLNQTIPLP